MADDREPARRFADEERLRNAPATRDAGHTERFTDEEAALLRQLRFGTLPRIPPADWVAVVPTDSVPDEPDQPPAHLHLG
ncbi:MAG: hypothetical protein ACRDT2_13380 [Natronosporangium sp.]